MAQPHEAPNVEAAAAALTEAESPSFGAPTWWQRLRWRQTSRVEAERAEESMLRTLVK